VIWAINRTIGNVSVLLSVYKDVATRRMSTVQSRMTKWRERHATARRQRNVRRAIDVVTPGTLQDELQAFARTQTNR
jgi:hypothetical protein